MILVVILKIIVEFHSALIFSRITPVLIVTTRLGPSNILKIIAVRTVVFALSQFIGIEYVSGMSRLLHCQAEAFMKP